MYNLRFIEMQVREEMVHIFAWRFHRSAVIQKLTERLQHRRVTKVLFWMKNAFWARPLQGALERHIAEYKEYEANRWKREEAAARADEEA